MVDTQQIVRKSCRFYENKFPKENDLVVVEVKNVVENGAYVNLLEYNNIEGLVAPQEQSRVQNMRSIYKTFKIGRHEVVRVLKVDEEKGYLDLSKKRVQADEIKECEERFQKSKMVQSFMINLSQMLNVDIEKLYEQIIYPLNKKFGHALDAFKICLVEPDKIFSSININEDIREKLHSEIKKRLTPQALKIRAEFELKSNNYDGIDAIKESLKAGTESVQKYKNQYNCEIKFFIIAPPLYFVTVICFDKNIGINLINEAFEVIKNTIQSKGGNFNVKVQPHAIGDKDQKDIQDLIRKLEKKDREVEGSEEEDNDEGMDLHIEGVDNNEIDAKQIQNQEEEENKEDDA